MQMNYRLIEKFLHVKAFKRLGSVKIAFSIVDFGLPVVLSHSRICLARVSSPSILPMTVFFVEFIHQPVNKTMSKSICQDFNSIKTS